MAVKDKKAVIRSLIESGKANGKLTTREINDALEQLDFDVEKVDKLYDTLESLNIDIVDDIDLSDLDGKDFDGEHDEDDDAQADEAGLGGAAPALHPPLAAAGHDLTVERVERPDDERGGVDARPTHRRPARTR